MIIWAKWGHKLLLALILMALSVWSPLTDSTASTPSSDLVPRADSNTSDDISASTNDLAIAANSTPQDSLWSTAGLSSAGLSSTAPPTPQPNNYIWIPWRSQFDGTPYASANCGPASLGIAMSYFGEWWSTSGLRKSANDRSGVLGYNEGTDWPSLEYAAEKRSFKVVGLYDAAGQYRKWTIADLVHEVEQKHPILLLVRLHTLPGHASSYYGDHYIVFLGLMADGRVVYHDSAFFDEMDGAYRIMSQETLLKAWGDTSVGLEYTAMSLVWEHDSRQWDAPQQKSIRSRTAFD